MSETLTPSTPATPALQVVPVISVFKSRLPSVNYIFTNGKPAIFINGRFLTSAPGEVEELTREIANGHPHLYIDADEPVAKVEEVFSMDALREQIIAEHMAKLAAATDPTNDLGTSTQGPLKPASSTDIAVAAVGGSGQSGTPKLVGLASMVAKR